MPTNRTDNYALSQWERSDRILMEDFNADNAKIDAALRGLEERVSLLYRAVPNLAFYLGQLAITDLSRHRKNMPQRSMLYEDFSIPEFSTLSGSALHCQSFSSAQVTVPRECGKREFVKIHDYALFFF